MDNNNDMILTPIGGQIVSTISLGTAEEQSEQHPNFIESNTQGITFEELTEKNVIPTFADGTLTLSSGSIIKATMRAAEEVYGELTTPEIRVSHRIQGRTPEAMNKPTSELQDEDITTFYQRMAFLCRVQGITRIINGQEVHLCIGATRSYGEDRLFGRPSASRMRLFVGWFVKVCTNGCLTCDGNSGTIESMSEADVYEQALALFKSFNPEKENTLEMLENLGTTRISESDFCKIIGRLRLYQALPSSEQNVLPKVILGDQAVNKLVHGYVSNPNFGLKDGADSISLWELLQLANEAVKQGAYIDQWLDRNQNCTDFVLGIQRAILGIDQEGYDWFLN